MSERDQKEATKTSQPDLLELIRQSMKDSKNGKTSTAAKTTSGTKTSAAPVVPLKAKGSRLQPRGKLGDFSRSATNSPRSSYTSTSAIVGYEEVPKTRFSQKHEENKTNGKVTIDAETEMIRKAIKLVLNQTGGAPSKRAAKRAAAPKMTRSDRVFKTAGPGSSRSVTLDAIKAIAAEETGCIVRKEAISKAVSQKNSNTTQGNYNPMIVE